MINLCDVSSDFIHRGIGTQTHQPQTRKTRARSKNGEVGEGEEGEPQIERGGHALVGKWGGGGGGRR